jgi:hypothetical protein
MSFHIQCHLYLIPLLNFFLSFVSFYAFMKQTNALIETLNAKALGKCVKENCIQS